MGKKRGGQPPEWNLREDEFEDIDHLYREHKIFGQRVKKELKRAERYCEFLSLIVVDTNDLIRFARKSGLKNYQEPTQFLDNLEKMIKKSVRETDVVSGFEEDRLGLLLFETPKDGATCVVRRLDERLKYFISDSMKLPRELGIPMNIFSFPDKDDGKEKFLRQIEEFVNR